MMLKDTLRYSLLFLLLEWSITNPAIAAIVPAAADSAVLKGRVEDGSGKPIHQAEVEVLLPGKTRSLARRLTDHEGRFQIANLPGGNLEIVARKPGLQPVATVVTENDRTQELLLVLAEVLPQNRTEISVYGAVPRTASSASTFRREEFSNRVVEDTGHVLRIVPGLVVVQHAGGGKSNQYLIRGFDADHGTDLALFFDGIPINMISHAHGQGYADLNFVIPETLETIEVFKGPYFAELGNLATAGSATLEPREQFDRSFVKIEGGQFDTGRVVLGFSPKVKGTHGFLAVEERYTDGPVIHPQNFNRFNAATRWTFDLPSSQTLSVLGTAYDGSWKASGQIPLREVLAGRLDRFGAVDPSEGGDSSRYNFSLAHQKVWSDQALRSQFYAVRYRLNLYSNFTFFARDPQRGDGIEQTDNRSVLGGHLQYHLHRDFGSVSSIFSAGYDYRQDSSDVGLFRQQKRQVFATTLDSHINERNVAFYAQEELSPHPTIRVILGLRHDRFRFEAAGRDGRELGKEQNRNFTGPKLSLICSPAREKGPEFFVNYGRGFHSNDARAVVANPSGVALAPANGYEAGYRQVLGKRLELSFAYWLLDLSGELVWRGDEGTTELSGPTRRQGPEVEAKWKISDYFWLDAEAFYSRGRYRGTKEMIARAPRLVWTGGLVFNTSRGLSGDVRVRHVGVHPLATDDSVQAQKYTVVDASLKKKLSDHWDALLTLENLFNAKVKEAQTYFESRLPLEPSPVADVHFSPGYPFTLRLGVQFSF